MYYSDIILEVRASLFFLLFLLDFFETKNFRINYGLLECGILNLLLKIPS